MPGDSHLFPDTDWLIGNHSDELTPWIPVIAARYLWTEGSGREGIKKQNIITCVCLVETVTFAATPAFLAGRAAFDAN